MSAMKHIRGLFLAVGILALAGCGPRPAAITAQATLPASSPSLVAPALTPQTTRVQTDRLSGGPTLTPLPAQTTTALAGDLDVMVKTMILTQADVAALKALAESARDSHLTQTEALTNRVVLDAFMKSVDEKLYAPPPLPGLRPDWSKLLSMHTEAHQALTDWTGGKLDPAQVVAKLDPLLPQIEQVLADADNILEKDYSFPTAEMVSARAEIVKSMIDTFANPPGPTETPTVQP